MITELDVETAALLAKRQGPLELNGVKSLTPDVARELARFGGESIDLRGLTSLPAAVAEALLPVASRLEISSFEYDETGEDYTIEHLFGPEFDVHAARLLVGMSFSGAGRSYTIPAHTQIGVEAAEILCSICGETVLTLRSIQRLDGDLPRALSACRACLRLTKLTQLTEEAARQLAAGNASLEIASTTSMSTVAVREIVKSHGRIQFQSPDMLQHHAAAFDAAKCTLELTGDAHIGEHGAQHLARAECPSITVRASTIEDQAARALARAASRSLTLYCETLTDFAAAELARFSGSINLPMLSQLRDTPGHIALASKLAHQCTNAAFSSLNMYALKDLGREVASALLRTPARGIGLGIEELSLDVAEELARFNGSLFLRSLFHMSAEVATTLALGKAGSLHIGVKTMSSEVAMRLASHDRPFIFLNMPVDAASVGVINALRSDREVRLTLEGEAVEATLVDELTASPNVVWDLQRVHSLNGWPHALPRDRRSLIGIRSVTVDGRYAGPAKLTGIGFTPWFPCLEVLRVEGCPTIQAVDFRGPVNPQPHSSSSVQIHIKNCSGLEELAIMTERYCAARIQLAVLPKCRKVTLSIPDLLDLNALADMDGITELLLQNCPSLKSLDGIQKLRHLKHLRMFACPGIEHLDGVQHLRELETLTIHDCPRLSSVEAASSLGSLYSLVLHGSSQVQSLRSLKNCSGLSLDIEGTLVGVPPALVKTTYDEYGMESLEALQNAIVECQHCGGQRFQGSCHGWYSRVERAAVRNVAPLEGADYLKSASSLFPLLKAEFQEEPLEDALDDESEHDRFPVLHAEVACMSCGEVLDPASFGARPSASMGGNWSELGEARSLGAPGYRSKHIVMDFAVQADAGDRPSPGDGRCPICCDAHLLLSMTGHAERETAGKFSGHVAINRVAWSELPNCFIYDEGNEKADGCWEWSYPPTTSRCMQLLCENECFAAPVKTPQEVPPLILACLALFEAQKTQPALDVIADWICGLSHSMGSPKDVADAALSYMDTLDPECVPCDSASGKVADIAAALRQKAKDLLGLALPLASDRRKPTPAARKSKQKKARGVAEGPLAGRVFCFTGRLEGMSRTDAEGKVKALGAATAESITKTVTDVVVGKGAGAKRAKALDLGLVVHDQEAFEALLRGIV